ncbi:DivIC [Sporolactobacillus sp. THM7-4]|nr:DivIC [Sporolactobacillus sp. THM7-4]
MENARNQRVTQIQTDYVQSQELIRKRKIKRRRGLIRRLAAFALVFTVVCFLMVSSLVSQSNKLNTAVAQKTDLQKKLKASSDDARQLKQRIRLLHDKQYIGEIARRDYLLSGKGEIIFSKPDHNKH